MNKPELRTGNVLFIDISGYSRRTNEQQSQLVETLNRLVLDTSTMTAMPMEDYLCLPTGDGLAAAFFRDPRAPVHCALELDERLKAHNRQTTEEQRFGIRMGINQGLVYAIKDINHRDNLTGDGITRAERVMDCGDAGHILISQDFADSLGRADSTLALLFHPLGEFEVKHGEIIAITNIYDGTHGNSEMPARRPRVAGTSDETAPALKIALVVSRPPVGYYRQDAKGDLVLVNPDPDMRDVQVQAFSPFENRLEPEELRRALQKAKVHVDISVLYGATPREFIEALAECTVQILHLDGYGSRNGSLIFESPYGEAHLVAPDLLASIAAENRIDLVILGSAHPTECVNALREAGVSNIVGLKDTMRKDVTAEFISRFYRELSRGCSLREAFEHGRLAVRLLFGVDREDDDILLLRAENEAMKLVESPARSSPPVFHTYSTNPAMVPEADVPFVGRETWMASLIRKLAGGGVVELHGEEGVGKSALARMVAQWHVKRCRFAGGVFWVNLTNGMSREAIWDAIGTKISGNAFRRLMPEEKGSFLGNYLEEEPSLIVLDNFDAVIRDNQLRQWIIMDVRPPSALLVTTSMDTNLGGVERLSILTPPEARALFIERIKYKGWSGTIDSADERTIDRTCSLIGYLPLAIILTAPRAVVLSFSELMAEIEGNIEDIANSDSIFLHKRYRSVNVCLNVCHDQLSEEAKQLFRRMLVFEKGANDELIRSVCDVNDWSSALGELMRASLLLKDGNMYHFHPLVRQYASARLRASGEEDTYRYKSVEAQNYHQQSSKIREELVSKSRIATSLSQLAMLYGHQGDSNTAIMLLAVAHDIFAAIGSSNLTQTKVNLEQLRGTVGNEQFDILIKKARSHPDEIIRKVLNVA